MNTLRAKISALLAGAIIVVIGAATLLVFVTLKPPSFEQMNEIAAAHLLTFRALLDPDGAAADPGLAAAFGIRDRPAEGAQLDESARNLKAALARRGITAEVEVRQSAPDQWPTASLALGDGRWLVVPVGRLQRPDDAWRVLLGWLSLAAAGTTVVVVAAVFRMTRPLVMLERAAAAIGPNGEMALLPETGPEEIKVTARAVNRLSSQLRGAMESRMRLVAAAGHDLRTPMTRMRLRAEFLVDGDRERWLKDLDELDRIADSAIRLVREETAAATLEPLRLDRLLDEIAEELAEIDLDVRLGALPPATIPAHPLALRRALRNLLVNAATHGGGALVALAANDRNEAVVTIRDRGPGIPDALLDRVFEPFFRVDPARNAPLPGAGLGLAIAKEIITRAGGTLSLENAQGGGMLQTVTFGLQPNEGQECWKVPTD